MLGALTILLVFQFLGEAIAHGLDLPIPGPVIGFALLFLALLARGGIPDDLRTTATGLLRHLSLLFVPDHSVRGFSVGVAAHGIGTARAFQVSEEAGAFSGLAMGLNGLATALLFPLLV